MLLPLVTLGSPPTAEHVKSLLHLQVSSPYLLTLLPGEAARTAAGAQAHAALLDKCRVCAGPFRASEAEGAAMWLDNGALSVFFDFDVAASPEEVGAALEALASLPAYRVAVRIVGASLPAPGGAAGAAAAAGALAESSAGAGVGGTAAAAAGSTSGGSGGGSSSSSSGGAPAAPAAPALLPAALGPALEVLRERAGITTFLLPCEGPGVTTATLKALRGLAGSTSRLALLPAPGCPVTASVVGGLAKEEVDVAFAASVETPSESGAEVEGNLLCLGVTLAECIRSDRPDGLFTTVVADECGKLLGLVYSSKESLVLAIREMRGIYYSRSRKGIWRKGESSGNVQELLRVQLDCDNDALLFTVKQKGSTAAFCHLLTRSCWGEEGGLSALERTLASRMVDAPAGSYTKRLFDDPELLRHKLMEEAQELSEASEPSHVAAEAADLIYFALVACTKAGVDLADVEAHLNKRSLKVRRRAGNSKEFRVAAAAAFAKGLEEARAGAGGGGGGGGSGAQ